MAPGSLVLLAFAAQLAGAVMLALSRPGTARAGRVYVAAALFFAGCAALFAFAVAERNFLLAGAEGTAFVILALMLWRGPGQGNGPARRTERGDRAAKRGIARGPEQKH